MPIQWIFQAFDRITVAFTISGDRVTPTLTITNFASLWAHGASFLGTIWCIPLVRASTATGIAITSTLAITLEPFVVTIVVRYWALFQRTVRAMILWNQSIVR